MLYSIVFHPQTLLGSNLHISAAPVGYKSYKSVLKLGGPAKNEPTFSNYYLETKKELKRYSSPSPTMSLAKYFITHQTEGKVHFTLTSTLLQFCKIMQTPFVKEGVFSEIHCW